MTYRECIDYFYRQLPMFHRTGAAAMKANLDNIRLLCLHLGNPEKQFKSIHIAGTNGKGSSSHMLAAILQTAGYKTGLYTSPHIKDFRERIRINGKPISKQRVVDFVNHHQSMLDRVNPSFFELTVSMAFEYFAREKVDIAIIEVGLGGRLDSTNIIDPIACLITNIGYDHSDLLGETLEEIAREKAGIIKTRVPVIISERHPETTQVFLKQAEKFNSNIYFAQDQYQVRKKSGTDQSIELYKSGKLHWGDLQLQLKGLFQCFNVPGILQTLDIIAAKSFPVEDEDIWVGLKNVVDLTGIKGRWQILGSRPDIVCDTGHNKAAFQCTIEELIQQRQGQLHMVIGFVNDKDIRGMLELFPKDAYYYFCAANVPRSLEEKVLLELAKGFGLNGIAVRDPNKALAIAKDTAQPEDLIFIGGSTFVVAELKELE